MLGFLSPTYVKDEQCLLHIISNNIDFQEVLIITKTKSTEKSQGLFFYDLDLADTVTFAM